MTLNGSLSVGHMSGTLSAPQTLSGRMSIGGSATVDPTLSIEGAAADAKAVGEKKADIIVDKAFGAVANMSDAKGSLPVNELLVNIQPVQAGTGDPSPTNIRTISGWTGTTIKHSGTDTGDYDTVTVSWQTEAGTVYGGRLNATTGELIVEWALFTAPQSATWSASSNNVFWLAKSDMDMGMYNVISDRYVNTAYSTSSMPDKSIRGHNSYNRIYIRDTSYSTATTFAASLSGAQILYKLAEPITYQLTPVEVTTLLGENNIWADCGDVEVEYKCDTKRYIQKLTMPTEDDMTANANIASGKYFMVGNNLYYSTASIANGAQIIVGTNCNRVSLANALNNINS